MPAVTILEQFERDGYLVLEDFLSPEEVGKLRKAGEALATDMPDSAPVCQFSTTDAPHIKDKYFLNSGDNISYFFEKGAVGPDGQLVVDRARALNKVGHALHALHPEFRACTFSPAIKEVCFQLGLQEPVVPQSMYIYKNPGVGGEVMPHQDATFLYTEPVKLVGFWLALDDATLQNGCLWFAPGSHKSGVHRRFIRNHNSTAEELLCYDSPAPMYPNSNFRAVPVKKGSCVVIHGQVVHKSEANKSHLPRHAYTFHVVEQKDTVYSKDNWLQPTLQMPFPLLYKN